MSGNPGRARCRALATGAWVGALVCFGIATVGSWGFVPGGMLLWSVPALVVADRTEAPDGSAGAPPAPGRPPTPTYLI